MDTRGIVPLVRIASTANKVEANIRQALDKLLKAQAADEPEKVVMKIVELHGAMTPAAVTLHSMPLLILRKRFRIWLSLSKSGCIHATFRWMLLMMLPLRFSLWPLGANARCRLAIVHALDGRILKGLIDLIGIVLDIETPWKSQQPLLEIYVEGQ